MRVLSSVWAIAFVTGLFGCQRGTVAQDRVYGPSPAVRAAIEELRILAGAQGEQFAGLKATTIRAEALANYGKVVSANSAAAHWRAYASKNDEWTAFIASLPSADELTFDGREFLGGNGGFIDAIVGIDGRAVALDRALPMFIVPVEDTAVPKLQKMVAEWSVSKTSAEIVAQSANLHELPLSALEGRMLADGLVLRKYAGRKDDLYVRLFQQGSARAAFLFTCLIERKDCLRYNPLLGTVLRDTEIPGFIGASNVLSSGGWYAVERYARDSGLAIQNPFDDFAFRLLPELASTPMPEAGKELHVPAEVIRRAWMHPRRVRPRPVPPLFLGAERFLGLRFVSRYMPVRNDVPQLSDEEMDVYCPLPTLQDENLPTIPEDFGERLVGKASDVPEWQDPTEIDLTGDKLEQGKKVQRLSDAGHVGRKVVPEIPTHYVMVTMPEIRQAEAYRQAISENDDLLAENSCKMNRDRRLAGLFEQTQRQLPPESPATGTVGNAIASLRLKIRELFRSRLLILEERLALRREMENRLRDGVFKRAQMLAKPEKEI